MRIPGMRVIEERRHSTPEEREEYRMANGNSDNGGAVGGQKVVISPTALGTLILTLITGAGSAGFVSRGPSAAGQADHDQITSMTVELRTLKQQVEKIDQRSEETNSLVRRLYYETRHERESRDQASGAQR